MNRITGKQFLINTAWKLLESILTRGVSVILTIVLARLLAPEDYGLVAIAMVFVYFSEIFIDRGFNIALIRKENVSSADYSTALCVSLIASVFFYAVIYAIAPAAAAFYRMPQLCGVLRGIAILLFFQPCATVITAKAVREMQFKKISLITIMCSAAGGTVGICLAVVGVGVWALVAQQVIFYCLKMLLLIAFFKWKFNFDFSFKSAKEFCSFSSGVISASLLDFIANQSSSICIGKLYPPQSLGFLNRGRVLPEQIYFLVFASINNVMLPALASRQKNISDVKLMVRRTMYVSMYFILPMIGCIAVMGERIIVLLMTDKWLPCVRIMQWYCLCYCCQILRTTSSSVFYSLGKSSLVSKIESLRCMAKIIVLFVGIIYMKIDIYTFAMLDAGVAMFTAAVAHFYVRREIKYGFHELFRDIVPSFSVTACCVTAAYFIGKFFPCKQTGLFIALFVQFAAVCFIYFALSYCFKLKAYEELKNIFLEIIKAKQRQV